MSKGYSEETKKKLVKHYISTDDGFRKTVEKVAETEDLDKQPSKTSVMTWVKNYKSEIRDGDEKMTDKNGPGALKQVVEDSDVDQAKSSGGGNNSETSKDKDKGNEEKNPKPSGGGISLDFSKISKFIQQHKVELGLALAALAAVVVVGQYRRTVNVEDLSGHGSSSNGDNSGDSGNNNDGEPGPGALDDETWDGE